MAAPAIDIRPRKQPSLKRWEAKKWRPEYERAVAYSALGKSNIEIAKLLNYTPVHVSNVLNLPLAKELKDKIMARMRERTMEDVPSILQKVAQKTAERLLKVVEDDDLFTKSPFAVIDRGLDVMKGIGHMKGGGNGAPAQVNNQQNNFFNGVPPQLLDQLSMGMSAANKALEINAPPTDQGSKEREG